MERCDLQLLVFASSQIRSRCGDAVCSEKQLLPNYSGIARTYIGIINAQLQGSVAAVVMQ
jgi:hypothetical protein